MTMSGRPDTAPERGDRSGGGYTPPEAPNALLATIWPLLGRPIAFHRRLVDLTGSVKSALLLSQAVYWTLHGRDIAQRDGWFHKTAEQWEREIGLSAREQTSARDLLRARVLLEEQRFGLPARLHFRLNLQTLGARLAERVDGPLPSALGTEWHDRLLIAELLGPAVAFHRALAAVAGGIHGGLLLSRALHLTRLLTRRQHDVWIADSAAHWFQELGLSRREQESARHGLVRIGVWEERSVGMPSSLFAQVRLEVLAGLLPGASDGARVAGQGPLQSVATPHPLCHETSKQECGIPTVLFRQKRHQCFDKSAIPYMEQTTGDSLQPHSTALAVADDGVPAGVVGGGDGLIFPDRLLPPERDAALRLLSRVAGQHQTLLDELAGRLQTERVRSPVAYLRGLIQRAEAGRFVPELAQRVAAERDRLRREAEARQARAADERRLAAERATPEYQARVRERRERISAQLRDLRKGRASASGS
jgi:hypothetical protein